MFQVLTRWLLAAGAKLRRCQAASVDACQHAKSKLVQVVDLDLHRLSVWSDFECDRTGMFGISADGR